ncbi:MAG: DEAD/DEAH box helicase, partial [Myxococcota bacterium]
PEGVVEADSGELERLAERLGGWAGQVGERGAGMRLCFRLVAPGQEEEEEEGDGVWVVEPLCQDREDLSLLVPLEMAWRRGAGAQVLERRMERPKETMVGELMRAARLVPVLAEVLSGKKPRAVKLDAVGAWQFLREGAPLLERAGFGVLVPSWWTKTPALTVKGMAADGGNAGLVDGLVQFDWEVALGEATLDEAELRRLAELKVPLVRFRGEWVELKSEELERALAFVETFGQGSRLSVAEAIRAQVGLERVGGMPIGALEATGTLGELLAGKAARMRVRKTPKGFQGTLRPYQRRGVSWLAFLETLGLGACLADDMGLGKTIQVLARLEMERGAKGAVEGPTLIVCPMSVVGNWRDEAGRFTPKLSVVVHHGPERLKGEALAAQIKGASVVITTYATATRDREALGAQHWHRVVLDEAQNIKNSRTKQAQALRALEARHRVALTGTPVENRLSELWSIMDFLNPGLLGTAKAFRESLARPIERYRNAEKAAQLQALCRPFVLRRLKTDKTIIKDLPDKVEIKESCHLTVEQVTLYQAVLEESMESIESSEGIARKGNVLSAMTRLKQVCNHPALLLQDGSALPGRSGKLVRLEEILRSVVEAGEKALVFTQYTMMGDMLQPHLEAQLGREVLYLHGKVSRKAREAMIDRFQGEGGPPVFVISLKAGGTGLTLTAANHVIHFDRWWNPAVEDQATDRAYRIGQRKEVQVRKFICPGTLEARIDAMLEKKKALADSVIGSGGLQVTEMSTEKLREMFALSAQLVTE